MITGAHRVVTFGTLDRCPRRAKGKSEDWPTSTATAKPFAELRAVREDLQARVADLSSRL